MKTESGSGKNMQPNIYWYMLILNKISHGNTHHQNVRETGQQEHTHQTVNRLELSPAYYSQLKAKNNITS